MKSGTQKIAVGLLILILVLAAGASALIFKLVEQKEYQKQLSLGDKYLAELDYENAELCYTNAININEKRLSPYWGLCNTYIGLGDYDQASEVVEEMQEIDDKYYKNAKQEKIQAIITVIDERKEADSKTDIPKIKEDANEEPEVKKEYTLQEEMVAAYEAFLKQDQYQGVRYAILNADVNQNPVLIIATETEYVEQYPEDGYDFDIYGYIDGSVVKIGHEGNRHSYGPWYFDGKQILCKSFTRDENMSGTYEVKYLRIDGAEVSSEAEFEGELPESAVVINLLKNQIPEVNQEEDNIILMNVGESYGCSDKARLLFEINEINSEIVFVLSEFPGESEHAYDGIKWTYETGIKNYYNVSSFSGSLYNIDNLTITDEKVSLRITYVSGGVSSIAEGDFELNAHEKRNR